jgi:hypothetical protein
MAREAKAIAYPMRVRGGDRRARPFHDAGQVPRVPKRVAPPAFRVEGAKAV